MNNVIVISDDMPVTGEYPAQITSNAKKCLHFIDVIIP